MNDDVAGLVARLDERALVARSEGTGTALGDALHFEEAASTIRALVEERDEAIAFRNDMQAAGHAISQGAQAAHDIWRKEQALRKAAEAKLREAVEMMQAMREGTATLLERYDDQEQSNHPHVYVLLQRASAFLATMEKQEDSTSE